MTTLLLIRHGESLANKECFFAGQLDVPLEPRGIEQARCTANFINRTYTVDKVYSSDLCRAYETAVAVAQPLGTEIVTDTRLREIYAGNWQGMPFDDILTHYSAEYRVWLSNIGNCVCTGGESVAQLSKRVWTAIEEIALENPGKTVVISTHATPIRAMQCLLNGHHLNNMKEIPWVSNASVTELFYNAGVWRFGKCSQDAHLSHLRTVFGANV